jgi:hypothetical protein
MPWSCDTQRQRVPPKKSIDSGAASTCIDIGFAVLPVLFRNPSSPRVRHV